MNRYLLSAATAAVAAMLASAASANTLYFQMNPNYDTGGVRQAFIFGAANATGTLSGSSGFSQSFDLGAAGFSVIDLPVASELGSGSIENKGFQISSTTNVSGYFLSRRPQSSDMSYLIDGDRLGTDYVVAGYQNILDDQISVQATADNTVVTFSPKGAAAFDVTLNAGQTYLYSANTNLTGSHVTSDKPIAVFSGNRCTNIPTGVGACDHIDEQMPSTDVLSKSYLVAQTPRTGTQGNVVRVVATADDTEVKFNGTVVATLANGEYYEGRVAGGVQIDASNKVLVAQYLIGQGQANDNTDPAMTIVPGSDQWLKSYVFATPSGSANFPSDFVSIVIKTSDLASLKVDGILADPNLFNPLATTAFSFGNIDVSLTNGPFVISADNPFQLLLSGFDTYDSYFTYGGAAFSPGASPPPTPTPTPTPVPGTRLHWDGDAAGNADNGVVDGGDGVWTAAKTNFTQSDGASNGVYAPQPGNVVFAGTGGQVTVDDSEGDIAVTGMAFNVNGYQIFGAPITLAAASTVIQVGDGTPEGADISAQINTKLTGSGGLTKTDLGTLVLTEANDYSGGTTISEGAIIGLYTSFGSGDIEDNADLYIYHALATGTLPNTLNGTGRLFKQGLGTLTIDGENGLSGSTSVVEGTLLVNGDLASSDVIVRGGATLGGFGTVAGITADSAATVAPGVGIGTLTADGDYFQAAGSTYQVELTSGGLGDKIDVAGEAVLANGAVLNVTKLDAGRYALGTRYTVLTAEEGLTGAYSVTGNIGVSRFVDLVASYDASNVYLGAAQTSRFVTAAGTPNQIAAATGVDTPANGTLYTAIAYLPTTAIARDAFDQISGELHATARGAAFEDSRFIREAVVNHLMAGGTDLQRGMWFHGYGSWGSFDGDGNAAYTKRDIGGFFLGVDAINSEAFTLGVVAGYGTADINVAERRSNATTDDFHIGAYGDFEAGGFAGRFGAAHMWRNITTRRTVNFAGFSDALTAEYQQRLFQVYGDIGYTLKLGSIGIEPFGALAYVKINGDSFQEAGGAAALKSIDDTSDDYWVSTLGGRVSFGLPVGGGNFGMTAMAGWRHASGGDRNTPVNLRFASGPGFDIAGPPIAENAAALGLTVSARLGPSVDLDFGYSGQVGQGLNDHGVKGSLQFRF